MSERGREKERESMCERRELVTEGVRGGKESE